MPSSLAHNIIFTNFPMYQAQVTGKMSIRGNFLHKTTWAKIMPAYLSDTAKMIDDEKQIICGQAIFVIYG